MQYRNGSNHMDEFNEEVCKLYKNVDEQIEYLKKSKNIIINKDERYVLEDRNYISVINPYKDFFATNQVVKNIKGYTKKIHIYESETSIQDILNVVKYDDEISNYFFRTIGQFERKFKNVLINAICELYVRDSQIPNESLKCLEYITEIEKFIKQYTIEITLNNGGAYTCLNKPYLVDAIQRNVAIFPKFTTNFPNSLSKKGYVYNEFVLENRFMILKKLYDLGMGDKRVSKNILLQHYYNSQRKLPLWVIPNALTLGELNVLFSMLDMSTQKHICAKLMNIDVEKIKEKNVSTFSGYVENIRRIRNVINHYEPLIPFLLNNIKEKHLENSQIIKTIEFLATYSEPVIIFIPYIPVTDYNKKKVAVLKKIQQVMQKNN